MNGDCELLMRLKAREPEALEAAIHRYARYTAAVVKRVLGEFGGPQDVEELSSDAFVALWENAESLREDSSLKNWLAVVARNRALKHLGKFRLEEPLEEDFLDVEDNPLAGEVERREEARQVRAAVYSLPGEDRDIFLRHYFWRQSVSQIAVETGRNENTVKSRLKRGREKLRQKLTKEGYST